MNRRIFMYATLPKIGQVPFGGGEVGNMRTIRMLREAVLILRPSVKEKQMRPGVRSEYCYHTHSVYWRDGVRLSVNCFLARVIALFICLGLQGRPFLMNMC